MTPWRFCRILFALAWELGEDERLVVLATALRLKRARGTYGELQLATDQRDWRRERGAEYLDALSYGSMMPDATRAALAEVARWERRQ